MILSCPRSRLRILSRETGSAVPSRFSLFIFHTQAESRAYSRDPTRFPRRRPFSYTTNRHRVSPEFYQVAQLRTDGVDCRESAGTGSIVLKVIPITGAVFSGITMDQITCASFFPHPLCMGILCSGHKKAIEKVVSDGRHFV